MFDSGACPAFQLQVDAEALSTSIQSTASTTAVSGNLHMRRSHIVGRHITASYKPGQSITCMMVAVTFEQ